MEKIIQDLKDRINEFAGGIRYGLIKANDCDKEFNEIVYAAIELYKRDDINLYLPIRNADPLIYQEEDRYCLPLYTDEIETRNSIADSFQMISFKDAFNFVYDVMNSFDFSEESRRDDETPDTDYPEYLRKIRHKVRFEGIMLNPDSKNLFSFDGWAFKAVVFKGMGANTFNVIDPETGETKYEI